MTAAEAFEAGAVRRDAFLRAMRCVASSVTVVTTDGAAGRHGATVSAFCSLSADPPSALVCLRADSRIARLVAANRLFCINVLPSTRSDLAQRFAGEQDGDGFDRFAGVTWQSGRHPAPVLAGATALSCDLSDSLRQGSHRIFVGRVAGVQIAEIAPLTYHNGTYCQVAPQTRRVPDDCRHTA